MSGGKETPRQKMIGMMYLVLTAMLALNVSTEILRSFLIVNDSIESTNKNFESKVQSVYATFDRALAENKEKVQEYYDKAMTAKQLTADFRKYVVDTKTELVALATGLTKEESKNLNPHDIGRQDNYDTPSMYFIEQGKGDEMHKKIQEYEKNMLALLGDSVKVVSPFHIKGPFYDKDKKEISWEYANFNKAIIVAAITLLNKMENDAMNLEFDVTNELFKQISAGDMTFDNVVARIIPKSTFVALGEVFEAEVFLVAFDSKTKVTGNINGQTIPSVDGVVNYRAQTSREGTVSVSGYLDVPGGDRYPFKTDYIVAAPAATVSPDKMNVFYIGVPNPISVAVSGVEPGSVVPTLSGVNGTITPVSGSRSSYIVDVTSRGEAIVTLSVKTANGSKVAGMSKFRVKTVPDPIISANGLEDVSIVERNLLANSQGLMANLKDFDFQLNVPVVSFSMTTTVGGEVLEDKSTSNRFTDKMISQIKNAKRGQKINFENIIVRMPTGNKEVRAVVYTVR